MAGRLSMGARREVLAAVAGRYRSARRADKGRILDELCATTGWHRKHAVRALRRHGTAEPIGAEARPSRKRKYGATVEDAVTALWEASDRVCGKRLVVMIPTLLPALERHGRLKLDAADRERVLSIGAATIDRLLGPTKLAAAGGRRRRVGFYSAIRREVPIRTFNDWKDPPPGFCEIDMVAHGGTSVAGSFIQTLTMVDVATGWTECLPLVTRDGGLVVEAINRAQSLFPWLLRGADFDNDSSFMNDVVVPWCRAQRIEVTRSRAYKKNDQAFVEQKNGAVVRRLVGYGRFEGVETAQVMARLYAAARLYVNFFQPSFKLKEKRREGAKVIKRYHDPATPFERARHACGACIGRSIRWRCWPRCAPLRPSSASPSAAVLARCRRDCLCRRRGRMRRSLRRGSATLSRWASRAARTGGRNGTMSGGSVRRRCLTRTSPRSRAGSLRSRS
jgi:hypothetical protein